MPRLEDARLLRGAGRFTADVALNRPLHLRVVRSVVAHGRLLGIETQAARLPGVVAILTADDLRDGSGAVPRVPIRTPTETDLSAYTQPVLAEGVVRYVGEPVAAVLAESPYVAEDAAELVDVLIEELPAHTSAAAALASADPPLYPDGNLVTVLEKGWGEVGEVFAAAPVVVEAELGIGRHAAVPLEPRALRVGYDPGTDRLDVWGATKVAVINRDILARMLDVAASSVHVHPVDVGGGFGARGEFYPEDFLVPMLARRFRRSVSWVEDRMENLTALNHSREQLHRIAMAFEADGRILAVRDEVLHDNGAYLRTHGVAVPDQTIAMLLGPYRVPVYAGRALVVATNKTPAGTYRAPGRFEGNYAREHLLDLAADRLGIDRVELRRRNLLRADELPCDRPMRHDGDNIRPDEGDYLGLLSTAQARWEEAGLPEELVRLRAAGRIAGLGVAFFLEHSGSRQFESADVEVDATGTVRVITGGAQLGQGVETAMAQIAAEVLQVPVDRVRVTCGDTEQAPEGFGSFGSRTTVQAGSAVHGAALAVRDVLTRIAAELLESEPGDLTLSDGAVGVAGAPGAALTFAQLATAARSDPRFVRDQTVRLRQRHQFEMTTRTHPYGVQAALVELDPATGDVHCHRYLCVVEVGRAVNPMIVEGQVAGGIAQGLGGALMEEFRYDDSGQPLSSTFIDYLIPTAHEVPPAEVVILEEMPALNNPLGVRGVGETGIAAVGAVMANAVRDALGDGHPVDRLPVRPGTVLDRLIASPIDAERRTRPPGHVGDHRPVPRRLEA